MNDAAPARSRTRKGIPRIERIARWAVSIPPQAFLVVFFVLPALIMVLASFRYPGEFGGLAPLRKAAGMQGDAGLTTETYRFLFGDIVFTEIFARSLLVALATTLFCLAMAYPLAYAMAHRPRRQRDIMVLLVILPFASNFLIRIYAWIILLGPLNLLYSPAAVVLGMVYVHLPFMVLPLYTNLERHDPALLDAARDLGARGWQRFWKITFPLSMPGIFSGSALVFIPVLGMFAVPELLGGTGDVLVGNLIKEQFLESRDWPFGAALSLVLTLLVLGVAALSERMAGRRARQ
jgi:spermidine/putrescine transport system permease protein